MIVDSSALLAILLDESEAKRRSLAILSDEAPAISAATLLETSIVFETRVGEGGEGELDSLLTDLKLAVTPFSFEQATIAREAFRRYGKGHHPARLNFGDCISYALAKEWSEPLLFKGDDFSRTDIEAAPY
jgi:ribonuclease VapC